jgi:hypothetical protein
MTKRQRGAEVRYSLRINLYITLLPVSIGIENVSGALSGSYLLWKEAREIGTLRKWLLKLDMKKNRQFNQFKLNQYLLDESLTKGFADPYGGVQVLYALPGSGK